MFGLHKQVEGQSAVGERVGQEAVFQKICVLNIRGRRDSLIGLQVLKEACCLWIKTLAADKIHFEDNKLYIF